MLDAVYVKAQPSFTAFETGHVRPLALHDAKLVALNTPDNTLEVFRALPTGIRRMDSVAVGLEPCAVAITNDGGQAWVVNHLSDSVSVVDLTMLRVVRTLLVGDEPRDIVFTDPDGGGPLTERAFITTAHRGQHRTDRRSTVCRGQGTHNSLHPANRVRMCGCSIQTTSGPLWVALHYALSNFLAIPRAHWR